MQHLKVKCIILLQCKYWQLHFVVKLLDQQPVMFLNSQPECIRNSVNSFRFEFKMQTVKTNQHRYQSIMKIINYRFVYFKRVTIEYDTQTTPSLALQKSLLILPHLNATLIITIMVTKSIQIANSNSKSKGKISLKVILINFSLQNVFFVISK